VIDVIDLFAGAGGFSLGAHRVTDSVVGVEIDADACATQRAAQMQALELDVRLMSPRRFRDWSEPNHLHASPPCTTFSAAGKGHGRNSIEVLKAAAYDILTYGFTDVDLSDIDDTTKLVLEPARWIHELMPDTISFEQVRAVLPIWEAYALGLEGLGYHTWTGLLHAEQYGVPQSRVRAWLMASKRRPVSPPRPTHSKYHPRNPTKLDEGVLPWVSMAEALGIGGSVGFPRLDDGREAVVIDGTAYRARDLRDSEQPSFGLTEKARSWTHYAPAGVSQKSHPAQPRRLDSAVAPTVTSVGNHYPFDPEVDAFGENLGESKARKITVAEAGVLQGFPADYPWQGTRTSQFKQAGNAVPPPVAESILRSLL
jgi:DNA (cytosine-5)-methyltransferase 1